MEYAWFGIILVSLLMYVLLDGYDLGAGTIALFTKDRRERHGIIEAISNVWDGNETWLVMVGVSLWAGFPLAFGVLLPHLYLPLIFMLFGLILRGFSIEYISQRDGKVGEGWYRAFGIGSLLAAFCQGFALGSLTTRVEFSSLTYEGTAFGAFSWYSLLMGIGTVVLYIALGYAYLYLQHVGGREAMARRGGVSVLVTGLAAILALLLVGLTPAGVVLDSPVRIASFVGLLVFAIVGLALAYGAFRVGLTSTKSDRKIPMFGLVVAAVSVALMFLVTHAPNLTPGLTIEQAASPASAFPFLLVGIGLNLPLLAYYNWFAQRKLGRRATLEMIGKEA